MRTFLAVPLMLALGSCVTVPGKPIKAGLEASGAEMAPSLEAGLQLSGQTMAPAVQAGMANGSVVVGCAVADGLEQAGAQVGTAVHHGLVNSSPHVAFGVKAGLVEGGDAIAFQVLRGLASSGELMALTVEAAMSLLARRVKEAIVSGSIALGPFMASGLRDAGTSLRDNVESGLRAAGGELGKELSAALGSAMDESASEGGLLHETKMLLKRVSSPSAAERIHISVQANALFMILAGIMVFFVQKMVVTRIDIAKRLLVFKYGIAIVFLAILSASLITCFEFCNLSLLHPEDDSKEGPYEFWAYIGSGGWLYVAGALTMVGAGLIFYLLRCEMTPATLGSTDKFEFYKDKKGEWRWRRRTADGISVAASKGGFSSENDCKSNAERMGWHRAQTD